MKAHLPFNWTDWGPALRATLMFIVDEERQQVLLIRKKRGLGAGKINGPGGKMDEGESPCECAIRETIEELHVTPVNPQKHGELWFVFADGLQMLVDVFLAYQYIGHPKETAEAFPIWYSLNDLPLDEMWEDDRYWLKELLWNKAIFTGRFYFDGDVMLQGDVEWDNTAWTN